MEGSNEFQSLNIQDLQQYLSQRGISTNNFKKVKLIELCEAVKSLDLPLDPDFKCQSIVADLKQKLSNLPISDPFLDDSFTSDFSNIPLTFTLYDIFNYLLHKTSDYDKKRLKAYKSCEDYRLFVDGHVENLTFNNCGDASVCVFRAKVKPTQRDKTYMNTKYYHLWFSIKKSTGEVMSAYCNCIGGMDGACRHVSAALYELEDFEVKSVTEGENKWMKRPRSHDCPVPLKSLKIVKARFSVLNEVRENSLDTYDPRLLRDRESMDIKDFTEQLKQLHPDAQAMDILDEDMDEPAEQRHDSCLAYSIDNHIKNVSVSNPTAETFIESLGKYAPDVVKDIESSTRGQSENQVWKVMRYGRLTASNFYRICEAVDRHHCPPSLLKTIMSKYETDVEVPALQWGRRKEEVARDLYTRSCRSIHKKVQVEEKGLYLMNDFPYIGCSVDGIFSCKCHGKKVIEIKCPYALKHMHPKEVALQKGCITVDNKSVVSEKSDYYHQMQGQMGIYGIHTCDLVIYTQKGIHVSQVEFDEAFFNNMLKKISIFFHQYLFKHLLQDVTK